MVMRTVTVELPDDLADRAERAAARRGTSVGEVVADAVAAGLESEPKPAEKGRKLSFVGLGSSTSGRTAAEAEDMLAEGFGRD